MQRAEQQLSSLQDSFDHMEQGLAVFGPDQILGMRNDRFEAFLGLPESALVPDRTASMPSASSLTSCTVAKGRAFRACANAFWTMLRPESLTASKCKSRTLPGRRSTSTQSRKADLSSLSPTLRR